MTVKTKAIMMTIVSPIAFLIISFGVGEAIVPLFAAPSVNLIQVISVGMLSTVLIALFGMLLFGMVAGFFYWLYEEWHDYFAGVNRGTTDRGPPG